jgi:hypothetical protein
LLKADFHIHTKYSMDCRTELEDIIKRCQKLGINCIAVSDHDAIEGALKMKEIAPFKVIIAQEVLTYDGEVMGLFMKEHIPSRITIEEAIKRIKAQGALACIPHPFDPFRGLKFNEQGMERIAPLVDIIEVFNARCTFKKPNEEALAFAQKHNLPGTAGSDAHTIAEIGNVFVELPDFSSPQEFLESLKKARIKGKRSSPFVHFHTTLAKIKRIF